MDRFVNHDQIMESLGAFALDAMGPEEAEAIRLHIEECPRCAEEVAQHQQVAALMGNAGGEAPAHLWDEIAGKIGEIPSGRPRTVLTSVRSTPDGDRPAPVASGIHGVSRRAVLFAAAAVVVIALLSWQVVRLNNQVDTLHASGGLNGLVQAALANPKAQKVSLDSTTRKGVTDAEVVVLPSGAGYLVNTGLPALPSDQTYQLWGLVNGQPISLGLLGQSPSNSVFTVAGAEAPSQLRITVEPSGGSVVPSGSPVASGSV